MPLNGQLQPGELLNERYRIAAQIGAGAMGSIYRGQDERNFNHPVVIKVINMEIERQLGDSAQQRMVREKEASLRITHPNVVQVLDSGHLPGGNFFLVQEFINGVTLHELMRNEHQFSFEEALRYITQIGGALTAAHSEGIVHRDLKPSNIMLQNLSGGGNQIKVIDFGIAKLSTSVIDNQLTVEGVFIGTPLYASPEQFNGEPPNPQMDIWALAVISYQMLTGKVPFYDQSSYMIPVRQRNGPIPPQQLRPDLPFAAQAVILKALQFDHNQRYNSARDFCQALTQALSTAYQSSQSGQHNSFQQTLPTIKGPDTGAVVSPDTIPATRAFETEKGEPTNTGSAVRIMVIGGVLVAVMVGVLLTVAILMVEHKRAKPTDDESTSKAKSLQVLNYRLMVADANNSSHYENGKSTFHTGDRFKFLTRPGRDVYLYIINRDESDKMTLLFPASHLNGGSGQIKKDQELSIPNEWFVFDEKPGNEQLILVMAERPVEQLQNLSAGSIDIVQTNTINKWLEKQPLAASEVANDQVRVTTDREPLITIVDLKHQ